MHRKSRLDTTASRLSNICQRMTRWMSLLPFWLFRCTIQLSILTKLVSTSNSKNSTYYSIPSCLSLTAAYKKEKRKKSNVRTAQMIRILSFVYMQKDFTFTLTRARFGLFVTCTAIFLQCFTICTMIKYWFWAVAKP